MNVRRTLPPAATAFSYRDLLHGLTGIVSRADGLHDLEADMKAYFGTEFCFFVSSGKAALTVALLALKSLSPKRKVVVPAYTCFSVPSAILKAGLDVVPCDVDPSTFDFDFQKLKGCVGRETLCVVPTHLLGIPADVARARQSCSDTGAFIVEDAAQGLGGSRDRSRLGTLGDVGFFSLGRGKHVTCGSGGIIVTSDARIAAAIRQECRKLPPESAAGVMRNLLGVLAMRLFLPPSRYWLPAGLPFLRLGETVFHHDFPMRKMDGGRAGLMKRWKRQLLKGNAARREAAREFRRRLGWSFRAAKPGEDEDVTCLRFPLLLESKDQKARLCALSDALGLGISPLYPAGIHAIAELQGVVPGEPCPGAASLADRLVTLPLHGFLTPRDRERICTALFEVCAPGSFPVPARPLNGLQRHMA